MRDLGGGVAGRGMLGPFGGACSRGCAIPHSVFLFEIARRWTGYTPGAGQTGSRPLRRFAGSTRHLIHDVGKCRRRRRAVPGPGGPRHRRRRFRNVRAGSSGNNRARLSGDQHTSAIACIVPALGGAFSRALTAPRGKELSFGSPPPRSCRTGPIPRTRTGASSQANGEVAVPRPPWPLACNPRTAWTR